MPPSQSPPKLHMLVSHALDQIYLWHVLGLFSEDPIKLEHYQQASKLHPTFANSTGG
jgi:hypothetical protein